MARQKKVIKYVPGTAIPGRSQAYKHMAHYKPSEIIALIKERHTVSKTTYYSSYVAKFESGLLDDSNFLTVVHKRYYRDMCEYAFPMSEEFKKINDHFMAEFDSREDLQEIYRDAMESTYHCYKMHDGFTTLESTDPLRQRPETYVMFRDAVSRCEEARKKIELARPTPYMEGDLVVLRDTSVDNADYDPLYISRYNSYQTNQTTPDKTVKRIGTVISVTEKISNWRASKGSKTIKVMWVGIKDGQIFDVPEKHIKFMERPTYANGMKTRE